METKITRQTFDSATLANVHALSAGGRVELRPSGGYIVLPLVATVDLTKISESGYTPCACRDCFDIAISANVRRPELCTLCALLGCDATGQSDCERPDAYGVDYGECAEPGCCR